MCVRLLGHPKTFPEGKVPTNVGGRGNAEGNGDRGTNQDSLKSCVFSSSVSTSAATFPMGEGLDRLILNGSTIATALGARIATPVCALARNDLSSYGSATVFPNGPAQFNPSRSDTDSCPTGHTSRHLCRFTLLHWATPNFTHPAERSVEWQAVPSYFKSGSTTPFFSNALIRSIQVPHFPQGFSPPS